MASDWMVDTYGSTPVHEGILAKFYLSIKGCPHEQASHIELNINLHFVC